MVEDADVGGYYNLSRLLDIWRIVYAIGAITLSYVLVSRIKHLEESKVWEEDQQKSKHMRANEIIMKEMKNSSTKFSSVEEDFVPSSLSWGESNDDGQKKGRNVYRVFLLSLIYDIYLSTILHGSDDSYLLNLNLNLTKT